MKHIAACGRGYWALAEITRDILTSSKRYLVLREAEIANIPFLAALAGCSARRSERRVASHTSEEQRRNAPGGAAKNGILAFSASLSLALRIDSDSYPCTIKFVAVISTKFAELKAISFRPRLLKKSEPSCVFDRFPVEICSKRSGDPRTMCDVTKSASLVTTIRSSESASWRMYRSVLRFLSGKFKV